MAAHRDAVRGFVRRLVNDSVLADDLTQETFVRAQRAAETYHGDASERTWLCTIALNLVRDHFRAAARAPQATPNPELVERLPADDDPERGALLAEMSTCIAEYVFQLPSPQSDVVALHDAAGFSHAEIAALLSISTANSRVLLHRGRTALRAILRENCLLSLDGDPIPCERRPAPETPRPPRQGRFRSRERD